ncbi:MAG: hypothetical protein NTX29_03550 [Actinobacteria bacterium]|nr:hypothetical protein [Actinomycetota bacterium]
MTDVAGAGRGPLSVSVVIPVYRGEDTLPTLIDELAALHEVQHTPGSPATSASTRPRWRA